MNLTEVTDLTSIGTLFAFVLVCGGVLLLDTRQTGGMRRFVPYYRGALLAAMLSNVLMLATGLATSVIYDKVIPHQAYMTLGALAIAAGLALLFDLMSRQLRTYLIDMAGRKADLNLLDVSPFVQQIVIGVVIALAVMADVLRRRSA